MGGRGLEAGRYRFWVTACNNDGLWNQTGVALDLVFEAQYWRSGWFLGLCGMTIAGLLGGAVRYGTWRRMRAQLGRLEKQHGIEAERARIARDLHDHLGSRLTEILLLTEFSLQREHAAGEQVKAQLEKTSGLVREAAESLDAIVWAIDSKNDTLDSFILYTYEYLDNLAHLSQARILRDVPASLPDCPLSSTQRHNLFLVLKEALANVFKHANASEIWFRLRLENGSLTMSLEDDGRGFVPETTSELGNGLLNMKMRMKLINGSFTVASEPGIGTRIRLEMPLHPAA
jgi:signal transduction histidine kinase